MRETRARFPFPICECTKYTTHTPSTPAAYMYFK